MPEHLDPKKTALLIIDVQQALFEQRTPIYQADALLDNLNILSVRFHQVGALCVFIQHANEKMLRKGTPGWHLHPDLWVAKNAVVVHKTHGNAFTETNLNALLQENAIDTVVIAGLVTRGCVRSTSIGAFELGYKVILVGDAHSSYHRSAAQRIQDWNQAFCNNYGDLLATEDLNFA